MPLTPAITTPLFLEGLAASSLTGSFTPQFALALATGLEIYSNSGLRVQTADVGVLGSGTGAGFGFFIDPPILVGALTGSFAAQGILGPKSPSIINAIAIAFSQAFAQAEIVTVSPTVGVGTGVVLAIPDPVSSASAFQSGFVSAGIAGSHSPQLILAVSLGLDDALPSGIGTVAIAGSPSQVPSSGTGTGIFI